MALSQSTRPEDRAALVRLGELLTESALEQAQLWPASGASETESGIAAAGHDLHHLHRFLASLGDARHLSALNPPEHQLAKQAARSARRRVREAWFLRGCLERYAAGGAERN